MAPTSAHSAAAAVDWLGRPAPAPGTAPSAMPALVRTPDPAPAPDPANDDALWGAFPAGADSITGVHITQTTALQASAVMICVRMLVMDVAKATVELVKGARGDVPTVVTDHVLSEFFFQPNDWQTWTEFAAQMMLGLVLRGNAYAVIVRNRLGEPLFLVPVNPDRVVLWQAANGALFYMVTRSGLHEMAVLRSEPFLIPARDVLHIKGLSHDGLVGLSPIALHRETIGLALGQEQQAARWMGQGAKPSGILTTDRRLTDAAAKRMEASWRAAHGGLINTGKVPVMEQGLKWQPLSMTSADLEFIGSRRFQLEDIARIFRIPIPMVAEVNSSSRVDPDVLAQHYVNYTLSEYIRFWTDRLSVAFGLRRLGLRVRFDLSIILEADFNSRINMHRLAVIGGLETQNEGRFGIGLGPMAGADVLLTPSNSQPFGSDKSGAAPDGVGRPKNTSQGNPDQPGADARAREVAIRRPFKRTFDPNQPRDERGKWVAFLKEAIAVSDRCIKHRIGNVSNSADIQQKTGIDTSKYAHAIDNYGIRHALTSHGNPQKEAKRGQVAIKIDDFHFVHDIISSPDSISHGGKSKVGRDMIVFEKTIGNMRYFYSEEVRSGARELAGASLWKRIVT